LFAGCRQFKIEGRAKYKTLPVGTDTHGNCGDWRRNKNGAGPRKANSKTNKLTGEHPQSFGLTKNSTQSFGLTRVFGVDQYGYSDEYCDDSALRPLPAVRPPPPAVCPPPTARHPSAVSSLSHGPHGVPWSNYMRQGAPGTAIWAPPSPIRPSGASISSGTISSRFCLQLLFMFFSARFQNIVSGTKLTATDAIRTQKHRQIRRLRYPNPMEDVPDQASVSYPSNPRPWAPCSIHIYPSFCADLGWTSRLRMEDVLDQDSVNFILLTRAIPGYGPPPACIVPSIVLCKFGLDVTIANATSRSLCDPIGL